MKIINAKDVLSGLDVTLHSDGERIAASESFEPDIIYDASGAYVLPGLIDIHVHRYPSTTPWGLDVVPASIRSGVTSIVDAGSAGAGTFAGLSSLMNRSPISEAALLNLSTIGLSTTYHELAHPQLIDIGFATEVVNRSRERIVGIKARLNSDTVGDNGNMALSKARELADRVHLPLMVDIFDAPPTLEAILDHLTAGDILTHCYVPGTNNIVRTPTIINRVSAAVERGVHLDVGHGVGSFSYAVAERAISAGLLPSSISTDLHSGNVNGPVFDLLTVAGKLASLGLPRTRLVECLTDTPREIFGVDRDVPRLRDSWSNKEATFTLVSCAGKLETPDVDGTHRMIPRYTALLTVRDGRILYAAPSLKVAHDTRWSSSSFNPHG